MRTTLAVLGQTMLLFVVALGGFMLGAAVPALRISRVTAHTAQLTRTYDFDWLIAVLLVYAALVGFGVLRKRTRTCAISATIALAITVVVVVVFTQIGVKETYVGF
jgi:predicted ABC-type sugar transport system permease subunit